MLGPVEAMWRQSVHAATHLGVRPLQSPLLPAPRPSLGSSAPLVVPSGRVSARLEEYRWAGEPVRRGGVRAPGGTVEAVRHLAPLQS